MSLPAWLVVVTLSCLLCSAVALAEPSPTGVSGSPDKALIDLNRASVAELTSLPGIGQKRAEAILAFRESHGGFQNVTQLLKIKGIGRAMLRKLRLLVTISAESVKTPQAALADATKAGTGRSDLHRVR